MDKYPLIGVSIVAVVLLILGSLTNVVGYQTVQSSNQKVINNQVDQKELLFQTIVDIANNKDIQQIILKSQINRGGFFNPDVRFPIFNTPVLTKNHLKHMYFIGLMLSKTISKSRIHTMVKQYQLNNQWVQKEITAVIEKDDGLSRKIEQLSEFHCNFCGNKSEVIYWPFPVICSVLGVVVLFFLFLTLTIGVGDKILETTFILGQTLNCWP
jgi:hypothetical protein